MHWFSKGEHLEVRVLFVSICIYFLYLTSATAEREVLRWMEVPEYFKGERPFSLRELGKSEIKYFWQESYPVPFFADRDSVVVFKQDGREEIALDSAMTFNKELESLKYICEMADQLNESGMSFPVKKRFYLAVILSLLCLVLPSKKGMLISCCIFILAVAIAIPKFQHEFLIINGEHTHIIKSSGKKGMSWIQYPNREKVYFEKSPKPNVKIKPGKVVIEIRNLFKKSPSAYLKEDGLWMRRHYILFSASSI